MFQKGAWGKSGRRATALACAVTRVQGHTEKVATMKPVPVLVIIALYTAHMSNTPWVAVSFYDTTSVKSEPRAIVKLKQV